MKREFPKLPTYEFGWRSLQVEPIPFSDERITLGTIVKGSDNAFIAAKLIQCSRLKRIFGEELGSRISDALSLCMSAAEDFYGGRSLSSTWKPPLEGFYISNFRSSLATNFEEALFHSAMHCSSFSASAEMEKRETKGRATLSAPELWRRSILKAVAEERQDFVNYFERSVPIRGSGVPLNFSFLSANYAAQFDAVSEAGATQQVLVRAQSKLWQLDRLRDEASLFKPNCCELLIKTPISNNLTDTHAFNEFIDELRYEASRRELNIFTSESAIVAAKHLIAKAA